MTTREEAMRYGLSLPDTYPDAPFHDDNWTLVRRRDNRRAFLWVFEREGHIWMNLKCTPEAGVIWRGAYASILPAYHMNKEHWISVILDGSVPAALLCSLIEESYLLAGGKKRSARSRHTP